MKYIIDTDDFKFTLKTIVVMGVAGCVSKSVDVLEELTADYINEHFGDLQDTAYQRGYDKGYADKTNNDEVCKKIAKDIQDEAYQRGLEDGKAVNDKGCEGCKYANVAGTHEPCVRCSNSYGNQWTAKDDKIEVGDEVIFNNTMKCLVVKPESDESYASLIDSNGNHHSAENCDFKKTGRHFDIASILEEMRK